ncbi:U-box domain-containing protein 7 [Nymphaea thermarum]|nr:U-box domain-containing protein 7 [Nymphaea thermarum]
MVMAKGQDGRRAGKEKRRYPAFSAAYFKQKILDAVSCGGTRRRSVDMEAEPCVLPAVADACGGKRSERLAELLMVEAKEERQRGEAETEEVVRKKVERLQGFERAVKELEGGKDEEEDGVMRKVEAALRVRRACRDDAEARATLAMLGAIPPLVAMLELASSSARVAALYALLNLSIGNDLNKAAIVKAGAVHKMLTMVQAKGEAEQETLEGVVANFLALSALDANKPIIGSSGAIPVLVGALRPSGGTCRQCKLDALRALYNLSIAPCNVHLILEAQLVPFLIRTLGDMELSDRILALLGNLVCTPEGRKAVSAARDSVPILIDVVNWIDAPDCQEKAVYILMVMAHKSYQDRQTILEAGAVSALLELTLIGSPLAQKRASRILEFLRTDKRKEALDDGEDDEPNFSSNNHGVSVSEPIVETGRGYGSGRLGGGGADAEKGMSEEKMAVAKLVEQSLESNLKRIARRANLPIDYFTQSARFKSLTASSTSKSLPF